MGANWLKKGFPLTIWNRTRAKAEGFSAQGARVAHTPREAAQDADVVVAMVPDDAASREVWLGAEGALSNMRPSAVCIESSTVTPRWARELADAARRRGCRFLDAPVGSGRPAAEAGEVMSAAKRRTSRRCNRRWTRFPSTSIIWGQSAPG